MIRISDISEKRCNNRVLRIRLQIVWRYHCILQSTVRVFHIHVFMFNYKFCLIGACVLSMNQGIRNHFSCNNRTQIFSLISFQKEFIRKVFSPKIHQQLITFNQICFYNFPVIVAIYIDTPD